MEADAVGCDQNRRLLLLVMDRGVSIWVLESCLDSFICWSRFSRRDVFLCCSFD